jgi:hypothetical protein
MASPPRPRQVIEGEIHRWLAFEMNYGQNVLLATTDAWA